MPFFSPLNPVTIQDKKYKKNSRERRTGFSRKQREKGRGWGPEGGVSLLFWPALSLTPAQLQALVALLHVQLLCHLAVLPELLHHRAPPLHQLLQGQEGVVKPPPRAKPTPQAFLSKSNFVLTNTFYWFRRKKILFCNQNAVLVSFFFNWKSFSYFKLWLMQQHTKNSKILPPLLNEVTPVHLQTLFSCTSLNYPLN